MSDKVTLPAHVTMGPIDSSHHSGAGYDADASHLYINFAKPGASPNIYRYSNFTPDDWAAYRGAESQGKHFLSQIKPNSEKFPFVRVSNPESGS